MYGSLTRLSYLIVGLGNPHTTAKENKFLYSKSEPRHHGKSITSELEPLE
jgi:hypothetical protein